MSKNKFTYIVTGCAGFIGYHVCKTLLKRNYKVVGVDNLNNYYDIDLKLNRLKNLRKIKKKFKFYKIDISNFKKLEKVFLKIKNFKVIHLAAQAGVRYSLTHPKTYIRSNLLGFWNVIEFSKKYSANHFIFASSSSVYGDNKKSPFSEKHNTDKPIQLYAATKKSNEIIAYSYSSLHKMKVTGLRFFTVYGPWGRPDMAIYKFTKNILSGKKINIYNKGHHYRDFTYIDDIVRGILSASDRKNISNYEIYNIGNGKPIYLKKLILIIEKVLQKKAETNFLPRQKGDMISTYASTAKFDKLFKKDFLPLNEGIKKFIKWFKNYYG